MTRVAAVDVGSNSVRLLVLESHGGERQAQELERRVTITKLASGEVNGAIAADAVERTAAALDGFRVLCDSLGVKEIRAVATAAVRDATNQSEVLRVLSNAIGTNVTVLSGHEEARLSFAGATSGLSVQRDRWGEPGLDVVIDIGGGSTEFTIGRPGEEPISTFSVPIGCVRITEAWLHSDPPTPVELSQAISVIDAHFDDVDREMDAMKDTTRLIGVAGSIVTVAAIELGRYDRDTIHQMVLTKAAAEDVFRTVATENAADRAWNPGLEAGRVGTIVGGAAILVAALRRWKFDSCLVSETDSLDALALAVLGGLHQ
jgi:exopolyphosphatase / guanosine-5'-triphosphate,3'-diphosphate pyrophosphatase